MRAESEKDSHDFAKVPAIKIISLFYQTIDYWIPQPIPSTSNHEQFWDQSYPRTHLLSWITICGSVWKSQRSELLAP